MFLTASYAPYIVIVLLALIFFFIYKGLVKPSVGFLIGALVFMLLGFLDPQDILDGLANDKIASIILLLILSAALRQHYNLELIFDYIFKSARTYKGFLFRMMSQVAILSSFINNTPVVALMTPYVFDWGRKNKIAPSRLLIPLSYATIMGGMITVIGTSTTLFLNGFLVTANEPVFHGLDLLIIGGMVTISGIVFITFLGHKLLPNHKNAIEKFEQNQREYLVETRLESQSKLIGQSISDAGLRNLKGAFLVEIIRDGKAIYPVEPQECMEANDVLFFAGNTNDIVDLTKSGLGLILPDPAQAPPAEKTEIIETVISNNSSLQGRTLKQVSFRNRYDAAVIAMQREGERISGKLGEIPLKAGDLLLIYAGKDFAERIDLYRDLYVISQPREIRRNMKYKSIALGLIVFSVIALIIYGKLGLFPSLLIIFSILVGFRMITLQDIKRNIDFDMTAMLVLSLAFGKVIINSGTGEFVAHQITGLLQPYGILVLLAGLMILTTILTSFVANVAAVAIVFPIALSLSQDLSVPGVPFYLAIAFAASGAFLTPIGYQTNLIVFGPGGYSFKDFFKVGLPVTIVYLLVAFLGIFFLYRDVLI